MRMSRLRECSRGFRTSIALMCLFNGLLAGAHAQQLLGSITGTVTDTSGAVLPKVQVSIQNLDTALQQKTLTQTDGNYSFINLPIGTYTVTFTRDGFRTTQFTQEFVEAGRTTTVSVKLNVGAANESVTVSESNQLNQVDTTNGDAAHTEIIENTPLGTGSFTQLAILSPGVNADLLGGSGVNAGLGNQAIWANGQRATSNS